MVRICAGDLQQRFAQGAPIQSEPWSLSDWQRHKEHSRLRRINEGIAEGLTRRLDGVSASISETFFEPVVRLGVTGLARSGKTVFITSLVANLLNRGRMPQVSGVASGAVIQSYLRPQPDDTIPRFAYEANLAALTGASPTWPSATSAISELRVSLRIQPQGLLGALSGPRNIHLDIVDYPGEWLLDLGLIDQDYRDWSAKALQNLARRPGGAAYLDRLTTLQPNGKWDEITAGQLAETFTKALQVARDAGFSDCTPGRFLMPGEMAGSPALTFAPLPASATPRGSLAREFQRRFEAYKSRIVKPFFKDHFSRIDRQIVLVDALGAIHAGPSALEDLRATLAGLLTSFRPGRNSWLSALTGKRVERILFAATKADHIHHRQHPQLTAIIEALVDEARRRADFAGALTGAMSIASLRATVEEERMHNGKTLDVVRGRLLDGGRAAAFHPGQLPQDLSRLLNPTQEGSDDRRDGGFQAMSFAPAPLDLAPGDGLPHIRLDKAVEFLVGDKLR